MNLPGAHAYVQLSEGACHYRLDGADESPVLLLLHGATVPEWEFDLIRPYFLAAGCRTLSFDLFGHGYSDRPGGAYDLDRFAEQTLELLAALAIEGPVDMLGHSLGAAVATAVALKSPEQVRSLVLAAPLVDFTANLPVSRVLAVPMLGELLARYYLVPMLVRRRARRYRPLADGSFGDRYRQQLLKPGFDRALHGLFRDGALGDQRHRYSALADSDQRVCLLWGEEDVILPEAQRLELTRIFGQAPVLSFSGAAHSLLLTHPEVVAPQVVSYLSGDP